MNDVVEYEDGDDDDDDDVRSKRDQIWTPISIRVREFNQYTEVPVLRVVMRSNMMGGVRRDSSSSLLLTVLLLILCTSFGVAVGSTAGFLYIDCGSNSTTVDALGISWVPDDGFITTGVNAPVDSNAFPNFPEFKTLRYFNDTHPKNCYSLPVMTNSTYLVRANFFYGGYDSATTTPSFQVAIDATVVANITKEKTNGGYEEFQVLTQNNVTYFCLLRDSSNTTPFISGLSLRPMESYTNMDAKLVNFQYYRTLHRLNLGGPSLIRYPDDVYDRYWHGEISPYVISTGALSNLSTNNTVTQDTFTRNVVVPPAVLKTAVSTIGLNNISLVFNQSASSFKSYLGVYLAEISSSVTSKLKRQFYIYAGPGYTTVLNDLYDKYGFDVGTYWLYDSLDYTPSTPIVLYPYAFNTTYGPLLNAVEFFEIQDPAAMKTKATDASAIEDIKATMNLLEWTGDPCLPQPHSWLTCGVTSTSPLPQVLTVNLSGYQLNTNISSSFGNLGALTSLALDNCGLNGSIPDLSALSSLKTLHLQNNMLSGSVPDWLSSARNLKELFIQNNSLSGNIDKLLAKTGLDFRYKPGNPLLDPQSPAGNTSSSSSKIGIIIGCVLGGIFALAVIIFLVVYFVCLRRRSSTSKDIQVGDDKEVATLTKAKTLATSGAKAFTLKEVVVASENFKTQIGKGGFGPVFYGKLEDGQEVAIKVLDIKSHQGSTEFFNEVDILSRVHHRNLVSLVGYCIDGETKMLLYEYIHEGSLHDHLNVESGKGLDWLTRLHIALNAAQGLDYLHTGCQPSMIHRDVKPSNILLTDRMESAKVSDFGLSRLTQGEKDNPVSTFVKGTTGYLDPEYFTTHHVSTRSDVYSFGVVLLELITGRLPINRAAEDPLESNLCSWVRASLENGDIDKILDPDVRASQPNMEGLWKVVEVALRSVEPKSVHRPTMGEVVDELRQSVAYEGIQSRGPSHTNTPSNLSEIKSNSFVAFDSDSQMRPR